MHYATFLRSLTQIQPQLTEIAQNVSIGGGAGLFRLTSNPRQLAKLTANVIHVMVMGAEASLDFYQMSAASVHYNAMRKGQENLQVELEPIVRVDLNSAQLISLIDAARGDGRKMGRMAWR
jgi:hypothetical protein